MSVKEQVWVMCCNKYKAILVSQKNPCTSICRYTFNEIIIIFKSEQGHLIFYCTLLRNNCLTHMAEHNQIPSLEITDISVFFLIFVIGDLQC